jgi:hypothetical protein
MCFKQNDGSPTELQVIIMSVHKFVSLLLSITSQRENIYIKYLPVAIPMVEETMIPIDKLTTMVPRAKTNVKYKMTVNR